MAEDQGTEINLCKAYCLVYKFVPDSKKWEQQHKGWVQVNIYEDTEDNTFRVVGWTLPDDPEALTEILINSNITAACSYKKGRPDFLKYTDDESTFGFGFYGDDDKAERSPKKFYEVLTSLIDRLKKDAGIVEEANTAKEGKNTVKFTKHSEEAGSKLNINQATAAKAQADQGTISTATQVTHLSHVKYDPNTRSYTGLPKEWEKTLNKQFGLDIQHLECVKIEPYNSRIPAVLVQMQTYLRRNNAFDIEGIFRLAPDSEECEFVKSQLNQNTFKQCEDINCIATLLKVWFRDLPRPILESVSTYNIVDCATAEAAGAIILKMNEPEASVMLWLVDLGVECAQNSRVNKMTPTNLGICVGPNLFRPNMMDPMASLQYSQKVAGFLGKAICWRAKEKGVDLTDSAAPKSNAIESVGF